MRKTFIAFLTACVVSITGLKAQTIQEGMNHLYASRIKTAAVVFEKLLAANPNNIDAIYWKGQTYLVSDLVMSSRLSAARQLFEKALQTTNGAPLIQAGMGHVELLENKTNEARLHFETALTMTHTNKGDDPGIEIVIGRGIADSKNGDFNYGIRLLEDATKKDAKNADAWVILGNLYRKSNPGEGGGQAFQAFKKALEINPGFALASLRLAKWAESIRDQDLILYYLNESVTKDPKFTAGYYELFYYYFFKLKYPEAEEQLNKYIASKLPESDIQDQFLYAQLCWAKKDYDCAVAKAESVVSVLGNDTKPKVYRLLADANYNKGDYNNARKYSDLFFLKKNPDDYITFDHELRAKILSKTGGTPDEIFDNYIKGAQLDTVNSTRIDFLKQAAVYFNQNKLKDKEAQIIEKIIELRSRPIINDYFDLMKAYYDDDNNQKSRDVALIIRDKFSDQVFGYDWAFKNSSRIDTVKRDSIAVPDALMLYEFSQRDTIKFRNQYFNTIRFLGGFYFNAKDKDRALFFLQKWHDIDTAKALEIQKYIEQVKKMSAVPAIKPAGPSSRPGGSAWKSPDPALKPRS